MYADYLHLSLLGSMTRAQTSSSIKKNRVVNAIGSKRKEESLHLQTTPIFQWCRTGQYMGNARKQLFFGRERFPSITCSICTSADANTWLHVLLKCNHHHIHAIRVKRHNKVVWELRTLIYRKNLSSQKS